MSNEYVKGESLIWIILNYVMRIFQSTLRQTFGAKFTIFACSPSPNLLQTETKLDEMNVLALISFRDGFRNAIYRRTDRIKKWKLQIE